MAPTPPTTPPPTTLPIRRHEANTITKSWFYHAIDYQSETAIIKDICEAKNVAHGTGKRWLRQRHCLGVTALRRTGKSRSGWPKKISSEILNRMLNPRQNPVGDQSWPMQIEHFDLNVTTRTLQAAMNNQLPRASCFKMAKVCTLSNRNKELRMQYGCEHQDHRVGNFFQYVYWSDEAHFDPDQTYNGRILREEGTRYEPENMQPMPDMKGVKLHVAVSILWHHKGELQFYNDEHNLPDIQVKKAPKPRKNKRTPDDIYCQHLTAWEAANPHDVEIKPKATTPNQKTTWRNNSRPLAGFQR